MATNTAHHRYRKPVHRRDHSDELDVFEAASYLSGCTDTIGFSGKPLRMNIPSPTILTEKKQGKFGGEHNLPPKLGGHPNVEAEKITVEHGISTKERTEAEWKKKKPKQPVTPSARLAGFLSSLFLHSSQQSASKKKPTSAAPERERRRRNSVSNIQHTNQVVVEQHIQPKSLYTCKSTGTRTPPHPNQKKSFGSSKSVSSYPTGEYTYGCTKKPTDGSWASERFRGVGEFQWEKIRAVAENISRVHVGELLQGDDWAGPSLFVEKKWTLNKESKGQMALRGDEDLGDPYYSGRRKRQAYWRREEVEDGDADSDSSSDLFELRSFDVGTGGNGGELPAYEATAAK